MEFSWNARPQATPAAQQRKRPQASKITLNNVQEHFRYLQRHEVLVCKEHATGILNVHLRDQDDVASEERKAIVYYCRRWQIAASQHVELPAPMGLPSRS
jgi:hypothetical protein